MRASLSFFLPVVLASMMAPAFLRAGPNVSVSSQSAAEIEDLGVIEEMAGGDEIGKPKFRASVATRAEFTTNARMSGDHGNGDLIFFPQVEVGFNMPLARGFSFDVAAKLESGIYTQEQDRGFMGYSIISTLDWRPKINWPRLYIGAEPYRYDSFDTGEKLTQAIGATVGTDYGYAFNQGYSLAFVGYSFTNYFSDPSIDNRSANKAIIGVSHQFNARLFATLFYQFSYTDFQDISREDHRHLVGGNLTYQFSDTVFGSLISSFADNDSTQDLGSYQSFNLSLGVNVQF